MTAATTWVRAADGLPQRDAYLSVLREAMARDTLDPVGIDLRDQDRTALAQFRRGRDLAPAHRRPAGDLVGRSRRPRLTGTAPEPTSMATVLLPRSLLALFPGAERRHEVTGRMSRPSSPRSTRGFPGLRDRLVEGGPRLRPHINVFVAGRPADLATPVDSRRHRPHHPGRLRRLTASTGSAVDRRDPGATVEDEGLERVERPDPFGDGVAAERAQTGCDAGSGPPGLSPMTARQPISARRSSVV